MSDTQTTAARQMSIASYILNGATKGDRWMCVGGDAEKIAAELLPVFISAARSLGVYASHKLTPFPTVFWYVAGGGIAEIVFRSGERAEKLRGPSRTGLWIEEVSEISPEAFQTALATTLGRNRPAPCVLTFHSNGEPHVCVVIGEQIDRHVLDLVGASLSTRTGTGES